MRSAPATQVVLGADRGWRVAVALCCASAAAALAAWICLLGGTLAWPTALAAGLAALVAAALSSAYLPAPAGTLAWDGAEWQWQGRNGELEVVIDLGPWMLLRFAAAGRSRTRAAHLPVSHAGNRAAWHGLRTAVYSRRPEPRTPSAPRM
ncbi:MAG: hypothetical protein IIZ92_30805 [Aquincola sp.]|nr:hypothetical protein [Aquincola sp.]